MAPRHRGDELEVIGHQPLHAADDHDWGGNCVLVTLGGSRTVNLHSYWDTVVVEGLSRDPEQVATSLRAGIRPADAMVWSIGGPAVWAGEYFAAAKVSAYTLESPPGCRSDAAPIPLTAAYEKRARAAASVQLEKAGVRLTALLNRALGEVPPTG